MNPSAFWDLPGTTPEEKATAILARAHEYQKVHLRGLALDLMLACFPEAGPPQAVVEVMRHALDLPRDWWLYPFETDDRRGKPHDKAKILANAVDREYKREHERNMDLRALSRELNERLGTDKDWRATVREWRKEEDWWTRPMAWIR
jgi:hypothetical protein